MSQTSAETAAVTQTLPERIAATIAEDIVSGRYAPGERLVEAALVKAYGVSHGPVRDALRILQSSGLVHCHPYRGAQVTTLSVREVQEIYQVRAALVGLRARWIAEDRPIRFMWIDAAELDARPELVRTMSVRPPTSAGRVRLVEIEGVDLQACGGTHVGSTGEVGALSVGKIENKGRQNRRISLSLVE